MTTKKDFMRKIIIIFLFFSNYEANAQQIENKINFEDRPRVLLPTNEEAELKSLLDKIKLAIENQDFHLYVSCTTSDFSKNKKKILSSFLENKLEIEFEKYIISKATEKEIEFSIRYKFYINDSCQTITSHCLLKKVNNKFVLAKEEVHSIKSDKKINTPNYRSPCYNGPDGPVCQVR
jgi:hypothetical protein